MVLTWEPITDLPQDWSSLTDGELGPLLQFWNDQRTDLEQSGALAEFNKRLGREWSIETGQIEGVYDIHRGITQTLIERGIDADLIGNLPGQKAPEIIAAIIQDHADVLEGLFQFVKGNRPLSKSYIHELHTAMLRHQDTTAVRDQFGNLFEARLLKGKYKERPNNPKKPDGSMHQYCPPEQVESEMERLLSLHAEHEKKSVPVEVEAAWLHHRFTQIHPYQDGNGRVARALASLLFIKAGWFPVVVTREDRARYIDVLELSDEGNIQSLITLFVDIQKRAVFQATQAAADLQPAETAEDVVAAAKRVLTGAGKGLDPSIWSRVKATADHLMQIADHRIYEITQLLRKEIGHTTQEYRFEQASAPAQRSRIVYHSDVPAYEQEQTLRIMGMRHTEQQATYITIRAMSLGPKWRALITFQCLFKIHDLMKIISKDTFQINYAESPESAERRFLPWLEESLVNALTLWRKSL
ncbi:MAG TPA: Fic family protein [Candidatus Angelobacter sp.]|nr:Fic family protein [Candidatus Angelobacter sp.]